MNSNQRPVYNEWGQNKGKIYWVTPGEGIAGQTRPLTYPQNDEQLVKNGSRKQRFLSGPCDPEN